MRNNDPSPPPRVSVVMAVRDGMPHLPGAVRSILGQSFRDFEFIVVDDGSSDGSAEWIRSAAAGDRRVVAVTGGKRGLTASLNTGAARARGEYIARMDADDLAYPERFRHQVDYLDGHPEVVCCGTQTRYIDEQGRPLFVRRMPETHEEIDACHMSGLGGFILHPSAMIRAAALDAAGGYDERYAFAQDYDLWFRLARVGQLVNLKPVLLDYRLTPSAITQARRVEQDRCRLAIFHRACQERRCEKPTLLDRRWAISIADPYWLMAAACRDGYTAAALRHTLRASLQEGRSLLKAVKKLGSIPFCLARSVLVPFLR